MIGDLIEASLPAHWSLSNLINLSPEWQANITDGEHVSIGTGPTIESALTAASHAASTGQFIGRLFSLGRMSADEPNIHSASLLEALGIVRKPKPELRRL